MTTIVLEIIKKGTKFNNFYFDSESEYILESSFKKIKLK